MCQRHGCSDSVTSGVVNEEIYKVNLNKRARHLLSDFRNHPSLALWASMEFSLHFDIHLNFNLTQSALFFMLLPLIRSLTIDPRQEISS